MNSQLPPSRSAPRPSPRRHLRPPRRFHPVRSVSNSRACCSCPAAVTRSLRRLHPVPRRRSSLQSAPLVPCAGSVPQRTEASSKREDVTGRYVMSSESACTHRRVELMQLSVDASFVLVSILERKIHASPNDCVRSCPILSDPLAHAAARTSTSRTHYTYDQTPTTRDRIAQASARPRYAPVTLGFGCTPPRPCSVRRPRAVRTPPRYTTVVAAARTHRACACTRGQRTHTPSS